MMNRAATLSGLAALGRRGDTELAHVNRSQRRFLKRRGGAGTRNPHSGLQEFWTDADAAVDAGGGQGIGGEGGGVPDTSVSGAGGGPDSGAAGGPGSAESPDDSPSNPSVDDSGISGIQSLSMGPQGVLGGPVSLFNPPPEQVPFSVLGGPIGMGMQTALSTIAEAIGGGIAAVTGATNEGAAAGQGVVGSGGPTGDNNGGGPDGYPGDQPIAPVVYATPYGVQYASYNPYGLRMPGLAALRMARGGLASEAETLSDAGRHGDTELVHLSPEELDMLRQHWGEPTTNPETGLPEYFKIGKLLKKAANIVVPAAATYLTGNPLVGALAGSATGLLTGKSPMGALGQGLLTYGAGKLAQGFDFGGEGNWFDSSRIGSIGSDFRDFLPSLERTVSSGGGLRGLTSGDIGDYTDQIRTGGDDDWVPAVPLKKPAPEGGGLDMKSLLPLATVGAGLLGGAGNVQQPASSAVPNVADSAPPPRWKLERIYNPGGGPSGNDFFTDTWVNEDTGERRAMATGGPVSGPGGGQDDSIPAMLSDGEYVIDAATVSDLGDGSTEAGAKKLDAMRQSIRAHKRGGRAFPPKAKNPLSYLRGVQ